MKGCNFYPVKNQSFTSIGLLASLLQNTFVIIAQLQLKSGWCNSVSVADLDVYHMKIEKTVVKRLGQPVLNIIEARRDTSWN